MPKKYTKKVTGPDTQAPDQDIPTETEINKHMKITGLSKELARRDILRKQSYGTKFHI